MKRKKKIWISCLAVSGVLIIGLTMKSLFTKTPYTLYRVKTLDPLMMKGTVYSEQTQQIFYDSSLGKISEICVADGQEVLAGTPLVKYANEEIQSTILQQQQSFDKAKLQASQAEENVKLAQQKYQAVSNRLAEARKKRNQAADAVERETLNAEVKQAEDELAAVNSEVIQAKQAVDISYGEVNGADELLKLEQAKANIVTTAAIDGTISVNNRGATSSDVPVVQVLGATKMIDAFVSEYDVEKVRPGQEVFVSVVGSNQQTGGKIASVSNSPVQDGEKTGSNVTYQVKIAGDFPWRNGLTTTVALPQNELIIPNQAMIEEKGKKYVFLYKNGRVKKVAVEVEDKDGRKIVQSGLTPKDKIIETPDESIQDGQEVKVIEND